MKHRDHSVQQKRLERQIQKTISSLLLSAPAGKVTTYLDSIASEDDFVNGQQTIEEIIPLLHAEDPKFFYNIFL
ncbi:hypothetical protein KA013_02425 [Patescibacteria group bacterium]|nr:hypothetical protein [Patescibacteria group bacterium]